MGASFSRHYSIILVTLALEPGMRSILRCAGGLFDGVAINGEGRCAA